MPIRPENRARREAPGAIEGEKQEVESTYRFTQGVTMQKPNVILRAEGMPGSDIDDVMIDLVSVAQHTRAVVYCKINGIHVSANPESTYAEVRDQFDRGLRVNGRIP